MKPTNLSFSPKAQFLRRHNDSALKLNQMVAEPWVGEAMTYALSQMAENGVTAEELKGAIKFREIFTTLGEPVDEAPTPPDKSNPEWENMDKEE